MAEIEWDALNCAILRALLKDGRLSQVELAERIPLSATAIARRIRGLEEQGVIQGYQARINRQALGLSMMVVVHVGQSERRCAQGFRGSRGIRALHRLVPSDVGGDDYLITVMARDLTDFERIQKEQLSRLPGVARLKSSFVFRDVTNKSLPPSCLLPPRK